MNNHDWTRDTWGIGYAPKNWQDLCDAANEFIAIGSTDAERGWISDWLWEKYCQTGEVCGVYEEYK